MNGGVVFSLLASDLWPPLGIDKVPRAQPPVYGAGGLHSTTDGPARPQRGTVVSGLLVPPFPCLRHVACATTLPVSFRLGCFLTQISHSATRNLTTFKIHSESCFSPRNWIKYPITAARGGDVMYVCTVILLHFNVTNVNRHVRE